MRNRIYDFAAASDNKEGITSQTHDPSLSNRDVELRWEYDRAAYAREGVLRLARKAHCNDSGDERNRPQATYAGLTSICRQIRVEYLSIQRRGAKIQVQGSDVPAYMATFHNSTDGGEIVSEQLFIELKFYFLELEARVTEFDSGIDLLPLLRLAHTNRETLWVFFTLPQRPPAADDTDVEDADEERLNLHHLFDHNHPVWNEEIRTGAFSSIMVHRYGEFAGTIYIHIKAGRWYHDLETQKEVWGWKREDTSRRPIPVGVVNLRLDAYWFEVFVSRDSDDISS